MIIVLIPIIAIIIAILVHISKKSYSIEKKLCFTILILNIFLILFFRLLWPGVTHYASITILFWINILINVIFIILLINSKLMLSKKTAAILLIIYFISMIFIPIYKVENHEHIFINENNYSTINKNDENTINNTGIHNIFSEAEKFLGGRTEKIKEYIDYYNCYGIKIKRVDKNN